MQRSNHAIPGASKALLHRLDPRVSVGHPECHRPLEIGRRRKREELMCSGDE
jgi:hypothetical protein